IDTAPYTLPFDHLPTNFVIRGSLAFLTAGFGSASLGVGEVLVFALGDPENPDLLDTVQTPTKAFDVIATEGIAYVACAGGRFAILDISPPQASSLHSTVATGGGDVRGITLLNGVLHVAAGTQGLRSYSLANPLAPTL